MANAAPNPVFLRAKVANGQVILFPLGNQKIIEKSTKKPIDVDEDLPVITRYVIKNMKEGQVYATNEITPRDSGNYVSGATVALIVDENAAFLPFSDDFTKDAIKKYKSWSIGNTLIDSDPAATPNKKARRVPLLEQLENDKSLQPPTIDADGFWVDRDLWFFLLRALLRRKNILLTGDTGCGKTELAQLVAAKVHKPMAIFDMAISNPVTTLCGNQRINEQGHSAYQYARFAKCLKGQEQAPDKEGKILYKGYQYLLDELSRAHPSSNNILLPLLDSRRTLYVENAMYETELKAHEDTCFWATANIGYNYSGTAVIDSAVMDRFSAQHIDYPPSDREIEVLVKRTEITKNEATVMVDFANNIRAMGELSKKVSTRQLIAMGQLVYDGYTIAKAAEKEVLNQYQGDETDGGEKGQVKLEIQKL